MDRGKFPLARFIGVGLLSDDEVHDTVGDTSEIQWGILTEILSVSFGADAFWARRLTTIDDHQHHRRSD